MKTGPEQQSVLFLDLGVAAFAWWKWNEAGSFGRSALFFKHSTYLLFLGSYFAVGDFLTLFYAESMDEGRSE